MTRLAVMMSLALSAGVSSPALADTGGDCPGQSADAQCEATSGVGKGWLWGGLAAVAVGAAAGGGGGSGSDASPRPAPEQEEPPAEPGTPSEPTPGPGPTDPVDPVDPAEPVDPGKPIDPGNPGGGREGGNFGDGDTLVGSGGDVEWRQNANTTVNGAAGNAGRLLLSSGGLVIQGDGSLGNDGDLSINEQASIAVVEDGSFDNRHLFHVRGLLELHGNAQASNSSYMIALDGASIALRDNALLHNRDEFHFYSSSMSLTGASRFANGSLERSASMAIQGSTVHLEGASRFDNFGHIVAGGYNRERTILAAMPTTHPGHDGVAQMVTNNGYIRSVSQADMITLISDALPASIVNNAELHNHAGSIGELRPFAAMHGEGAAAMVYNRGTITVIGNDSVGMSGARGATLINDGTINLGTRDQHNVRGMVAMQSDGSAIVNNRVGGVINIHAEGSYAFGTGPESGGRVINNGTINFFAFNAFLHADPTWRPGVGADLVWQAEPMPQPVISGYTVGTNADGSAGTLRLAQGAHIADVRVDTGFTRGTAESQVHLRGVFTGVDSGEQNIISDAVTWRAQAARDEDGTVDVVMTRNDYRDLADEAQQGIADVLEAGYSNNALFHSLEVSSKAQFNQALQQLAAPDLARSSLRLAANGDAFWSSLAMATPAEGSRVLNFGTGAAGRHGVQGNGSGMQFALPLANGHHLQLSSGVLASDFSTEGGNHRSRSHFAGIGVAQHVGSFTLQHVLSSEWHRLDGRRALNWGSTRSEAHSQRSLSRTRAGSMLGTSLTSGVWQWQPRLSVMAYQGREAAFTETGAGLLGLSVDAGRYRDVQWETGAALSARLGSRWTLRGDAALMGSLAYQASERNARLLGAAGEGFMLHGATPTGQDHRLMLGADYRHKRLNIGSSVATQRRLGFRDVQADLQLRLAY